MRAAKHHILTPLLSAFFLLSQPAWAQKETLRVPLWIQSDVSLPEQALNAENWKVQLGSEPGKTVEVLGPDDGMLLILVADLVGGLSQAQLAKNALRENIQNLPQHVRVAFLRAQDGLKVLADPAGERGPLLAAIQSLPISGNAGLLETVQEAVRVGDAVLNKAAVRVAVLYVTDSEVSRYREDFTNPTINNSDSGDVSRRFRDSLIRDRMARLDAALAATETPVFIVHLNYRTDALNLAYQTGLMTLASTTGGSAWFCRSQTEIGEAISKAFEAIGSHYSLIVEIPPEPLPKLLEINLESPGRTLTWRTRYALNGRAPSSENPGF